jgi:hypothetical protein
MRFSKLGFGLVAATALAAGGAPPSVHQSVQQNSAKPQTSSGKSLNVIADSARGLGNSIIIDGDDFGGSTTIIRNSRNGIGNRILIDGREVPATQGHDTTLFYRVPSSRWTPLRAAKRRQRLRQRLQSVSPFVAAEKSADQSDATPKVEPTAEPDVGSTDPNDDLPPEQKSKIKDLINDPLMKMYIPHRAMNILKAIAGEGQ